MKCSLDISNFLEEISSFSRSTVFLYFFALFNLRRLNCISSLFSGTLHSIGYVSAKLLAFALLLLYSMYDRNLGAESEDGRKEGSSLTCNHL